MYQREYYKNGKKPWFYCFRYRKQKYTMSGFMTKAEAILAEQRVQKTVILDNKPNTPSVTLSFKELLPAYFRNRETTNALGTVEREKRLIHSFLEEIGAKQTQRVSIADILGHIQQRKKAGISNRTINLEINLLRCAFKYAIDVGASTHNPAKEVKKLKVVKKQVVIPQHDGFLCLISTAGEARHGKQLVVWIWFRVYTSVRPKESFFVEWKDVDFENNLIHIVPKPGNQLKDSQCRHIIMVPALRKLLLDWRQEWLETFKGTEKPHDWVFFHPLQPHKQAFGFRRAFTKAREKAGIPNLTSHGLRHYSLSHGVMSGVSKDVLRRQAGHTSTLMIEQTYGHLYQPYQTQEMSKFSFFHPKNGSKSEENDGQLIGNSQPQITSGSPVGAPKEIIGFKSEEENITQVVDNQTEKRVEAGGLEPPTR
ncbi:MAG: tyrosine-type recombinase/integrase [Proteobacteria bacterium]|nr:tyrosine-type recombinase/integrase [Pseudomonadota bacterium]MBU1739878.1 tyrosine-type recombinase/integrase [Pseudomonadota bacterium]